MCDFLARLAVVVAIVLVAPATALADGFDVVWFLTRVGGWSIHPFRSTVIVLGLMLVNYLLNLAVIGIPAARLLNIKPRALLPELAVFTILAQIADRLSAIGGLALSFPVIGLFGLRGEQALRVGFLVAIALNFIFSGLAVASLTFWYMTRRWKVQRRRATAVAIRAAVLTNPGWAMIPWVISS